MHVLWTPSWYPTESQPFNGSFFAEQVSMLRSSGIEVGVIALNPTTAWKKRETGLRLNRAEQVIHQDFPTVPLGIVPGDRQLIELFSARIAKVYEEEFGVPDVIHSHSVFPGILVAQALSRRWGVPYGITEHRPSSLTRNPKSYRYRMIRDAVCGASFHYAVSPDFAEKLSEYYGCSTFGVMSLPVPGRFFEQPTHVPDTDTFTFMHVSHLDRNKRVEESLLAFDAVYAEFPHTRFLVIGGDPERVRELRSFAADLRCHDAIEFAGRVGRDQMPGEMNRGDCLILFSAREAGGTVFAEAQSMGIPCIATATPGGRHMATDGMGCVVPIDDTSAFARAMKEMVSAYTNGQGFSNGEIRHRAWGRSSASVFINRHLVAYRKVIDAYSRKKRALVVSRIHMPEASAASFRLEAVEKALTAQGADVRVITSKPPSSAPTVSSEPNIVRVPVLRDKSDYLRGYLPYMSFDSQASFRALIGSKPDVALVEPPPTTGSFMRLVSLVRRFPYVWYAADVWSDASESTGAPNVVVRAVKMMESFAISGASGVVAVSDGVAKRVRELGGRNVLVQPNGADTELFNPTGRQLTTEELAAAGVKHPYFIYAGTASEWQGAEIFVEAFSKVLDQYPDTQIVFLARGSQVPRIEEQALSLATATGITNPVVVLEPVGPEEAAAWQRGAIGALVSIVPGLGYDFAYPTKVLTALASGTPVVYAGAGPATVDITNHQLGEVAEFSADKVASAMLKVRRSAATDAERERLAEWVQDHKSMSAMGEAVASFVLSCARSERS